MKRFIWGGSTLAILLLMSTILGSQPFHPPLQHPARIAKWPGRTGNELRLNADKHRGQQTRAQIAAQDMAVTTALCVREFRFALQHLANLLDHTTDPALRSRLLQETMQEHPQFRSLLLIAPDGQTIGKGSFSKPERMQESVDGVRKTGQFYISDLYDAEHPQAARSTGRPGEKTSPHQPLLMSIALPLLHKSQVAGTLAAEVEMGYLRSVADQVDDQMGTHSLIQNHDGDPVLLHPEQAGAWQEKQMVQHGVDGTKWRASSFTVRQTAGDGRKNKPNNEVVVQFHAEPDGPTLEKIKRDIQGEIVRKNHAPTYVFRSKNMSTDQLTAYFRSIGVKLVEPNYRLRQNELPNDVLYQRYQWNFPKIQIENAWKFSTGDPHSVIAVVDTGVDLDHPEFQGQLVPGHNMIEDTDTPQDDNGHGTHVSGVIVARTNNIEGVAGMNWSSRVMPIKALDADGSGSVFDIADGIRWAADHDAKVINLSLGEYEDSEYLRESIRYAAEKDVLVVAAMGNDDTSQASYPAAYPEVLAVSAVDENGQRATFSNYGEHTGVAAPGVSIASTFPGNRYAAMSGTSMASPHVAGLAGLIRALNPNLKADQVKDIIVRTAADLGPQGKDPYYGAGLINVSEALKIAQTYQQPTDLRNDRQSKPIRKPWWWPFSWFRG